MTYNQPRTRAKDPLAETIKAGLCLALLTGMLAWIFFSWWCMGDTNFSYDLSSSSDKITNLRGE